MAKQIKALKCPQCGIAIPILIATFAQIYWAMGSFSDQLSSADLERWFVEDAVYMSLLTAVVLGVLFGFITCIRNKYVKYSVQAILLISVWFFWNYTVFVERESSWSTYLFHEEISYVATYSFLPVLVLGPLTLLVIWLFKKKKVETTKHSDAQWEDNRSERLIFNGKFTLVTEGTEFRMALWINGFGLTNTSTKEEILPVMHSCNLDYFKEQGNMLSVKFRIYPDGMKNYQVEINPFEKTFT